MAQGATLSPQRERRRSRLREPPWSYLRGFVQLWDPTALDEFLHRADPAGRWQSREIRR